MLKNENARLKKEEFTTKKRVYQPLCPPNKNNLTINIDETIDIANNQNNNINPSPIGSNITQRMNTSGIINHTRVYYEKSPYVRQKPRHVLRNLNNRILNTLNSESDRTDRTLIINRLEEEEEVHANMSNMLEPLENDEENEDTTFNLNNINIDNMTYEEILALQEKIGFVSRGFKSEQIEVLYNITF